MTGITVRAIRSVYGIRVRQPPGKNVPSRIEEELACRYSASYFSIISNFRHVYPISTLRIVFFFCASKLFSYTYTNSTPFYADTVKRMDVSKKLLKRLKTKKKRKRKQAMRISKRIFFYSLYKTERHVWKLYVIQTAHNGVGGEETRPSKSKTRRIKTKPFESNLTQINC